MRGSFQDREAAAGAVVRREPALAPVAKAPAISWAATGLAPVATGQVAAPIVQRDRWQEAIR
jgi:hypothetical protein